MRPGQEAPDDGAADFPTDSRSCASMRPGQEAPDDFSRGAVNAADELGLQ